tara:strand:+ start:198 stop:548 length:351 start_codon:yes stop_codon:yes gene_type:complete
MYAQKVKYQNINKCVKDNLPYGWIKIKNDVKYIVPEKEITQEEFEYKANKAMNEIVDRFIEYKKNELRLENLSEESIEKIIEELLTFHDDYDEYPCDEYCESDYDSNDEYSDDDLF